MTTSDPLFKDIEEIRLRNRWILSFLIHGSRAILYATLWHWNTDIATGILPALHCWYCVPSHAPYGILWYIFSFPGGVFNLQTEFIAYTAVVDQVIMYFIRPYKNLFWAYVVCSFWIWLQAPYDLPILWIASLGMLRKGTWPLTLLAPLSKLPVGAPASVWHYVLTKPYLFSDYQYFTLMGIVILAFLAQGIKNYWRPDEILQS